MYMLDPRDSVQSHEWTLENIDLKEADEVIGGVLNFSPEITEVAGATGVFERRAVPGRLAIYRQIESYTGLGNYVEIQLWPAGDRHTCMRILQPHATPEEERRYAARFRLTGDDGPCDLSTCPWHLRVALAQHLGKLRTLLFGEFCVAFIRDLEKVGVICRGDGGEIQWLEEQGRISFWDPWWVPPAYVPEEGRWVIVIGDTPLDVTPVMSAFSWSPRPDGLEPEWPSPTGPTMARNRPGRPGLPPNELIYRLAQAQRAEEIKARHPDMTWKEIAREIGWTKGTSKAGVKLLEDARHRLERARKSPDWERLAPKIQERLASLREGKELIRH